MTGLTLPPSLQKELGQRDLIVFDGECVLCSAFMQFIFDHDNDSHFAFVLAQSQLGQDIYTALDLPTDTFETNLVIVRGQVWTKLQAFGAAMSRLGWPWKLGALAFIIPRVIGNPTYNAIARNRYRIWGRTATCLVPSDALRSRFLGGLAI
ncbi:thiol-disulfide oxidoreductase DCC family protein [Pontivivens insulae]|uniref:Thiol-disulfide oxidoreductase DCC n=1 Tax=Pontivivens insulae TaxID=1639689 RepID=A0A2R8AC78_9RHOB|nr:DCC1-like thiol-disulfide oxidoreductase family protein [Pontivivens insulae]RED11168.1 putative DCC family thiol-disulfide oxidoreductase YuxK [Pontivivens insulae]SPF29658.1 hypothetical protein POI8812_01974 [Pontivivens insulae]